MPHARQASCRPGSVGADQSLVDLRRECVVVPDLLEQTLYLLPGGHLREVVSARLNIRLNTRLARRSRCSARLGSVAQRNGSSGADDVFVDLHHLKRNFLGYPSWKRDLFHAHNKRNNNKLREEETQGSQRYGCFRGRPRPLQWMRVASCTARCGSAGAVASLRSLGGLPRTLFGIAPVSGETGGASPKSPSPTTSSDLGKSP